MRLPRLKIIWGNAGDDYPSHPFYGLRLTRFRSEGNLRDYVGLGRQLVYTKSWHDGFRWRHEGYISALRPMWFRQP